jgi:hypothetical protein
MLRRREEGEIKQKVTKFLGFPNRPLSLSSEESSFSSLPSVETLLVMEGRAPASPGYDPASRELRPPTPIALN